MSAHTEFKRGSFVPSVSEVHRFSRRTALKKTADIVVKATVLAYLPAVALDRKNDQLKSEVQDLEEDPAYHRSPSIEQSYDGQIEDLNAQIANNQEYVTPLAAIGTGGVIYIAAKGLVEKFRNLS